jgi:uncharacterized membrane-anchored protein
MHDRRSYTPWRRLRLPPLRLAIALLLASLACRDVAAEPRSQGKEASGLLGTTDQAFADAMRQSIGAPARADLGDQATERLDGQPVLVPRDPAIHLLTVTQHPVPDGLMALLLLGDDAMNALGYIRFIPAGFIDSDAALAWTADDFLDSLRDTVAADNAARVRQGLQEREVRRWIRPPRYNPESHQISWAALIVPKSAPRETDGEITFYAVAFGRQGYIQLSTVTSVEQADGVGRMADTFLDGLNFVPGKTVRDVQSSDPRAPGGLAAAMGIVTLHKSRDDSSFWSSDTVIPTAGGLVASVGALSLFFYIQRHLRREARRG